MKITKAQQRSLKRKFDISSDGAASFLSFRRRVITRRAILPDTYIMLPWCGMMLGIEPDGHCHS